MFIDRRSAYEKRCDKTLAFLDKHIDPKDRILDLGVPNDMSERMRQRGYTVTNTQGENLDIAYQDYLDRDVEVVTALEIFEHMLAPFNILRELKTEKLIASIPLRLWFASAYWNEKDEWDKHYHEFEKKQFDLLLERSGWQIIDSEQWANGDWSKVGIRPILRHFYPRYYMVCCKRG